MPAHGTGFVRPYFHRFSLHRDQYSAPSGLRIRFGSITPQVFLFGAPRGIASLGAVGFVLVDAA